MRSGGGNDRKAFVKNVLNILKQNTYVGSGKSDWARYTTGLVVAVLLALVIDPNVLSAASVSGQRDTPQSWTMYAMTPGHNAWYASSFPAVSWSYQVPGATEANNNKLLDHTMVRDLVGFPIGVAVVDGTVYATNDDGYVYALDARTGKLRWRFHAFNQLMGTPLVGTLGGRTLVFAGAGNSVFAYSHAVNFASSDRAVVRGNGLSAIFALDAATGKLVWAYPTQGEDMPTPVLYRGHLLFGNGDGHVYSLDAASGKFTWKSPIHSFVSMSSATLDAKSGVMVMGGTQPSKIYGLYANSGKLLWSVAPPNVFSSSAGDG
ncbi:MAG: PQQ-binding-like beta-propeller repeat protein, partial [bacterium]